jgi:hypothetical protein
MCMIMAPLFPCPCCHAPVVSEPGGFEICPICGWEDDPVQSVDASYAGGANELSLQEYREEWRRQVFSVRQGQPFRRS